MNPVTDIELRLALPEGRELETWDKLDETEQEIMTILCLRPGRENAIHVDDLAKLVGIGPRNLQSVAKVMVEEHGIRIGKGVADGYFIITNAKEGHDAAYNHLRRALSNLRAFKALLGLTDVQFEAEIDAIKGQLRLFNSGAAENL